MDACPICDGVQTAFYARQDGYDFVACRSCGFVFLFPMPDAASLAAVYDDAAFGVGRYPKAKSRMRRATQRALGLWPHFFRKDAIDVGCGGGFVAEAMRRLGARGRRGSTSVPVRSPMPGIRFRESAFSKKPSNASSRAASPSTSSTRPKSSNISAT